MKKSNVIVYGAIVFVSLLLAGCISNEKPKQEEADKQIIAQMSLEWAVLDKNIPDYNIIKYKNHFVLSTRNIDKSYNFSLENITITILTPEEIKQKSEAEGDFLYFEFEKIDISSSGATVKLNNIWAQNETSRKTMAYLSGGGATIPFTKEGDKWVRQDVTETWIS
jgi:PBP1b-binding outer membrane lipoprotein LpoB